MTRKDIKPRAWRALAALLGVGVLGLGSVAPALARDGQSARFVMLENCSDRTLTDIKLAQRITGEFERGNAFFTRPLKPKQGVCVDLKEAGIDREHVSRIRLIAENGDIESATCGTVRLSKKQFNESVEKSTLSVWRIKGSKGKKLRCDYRGATRKFLTPQLSKMCPTTINGVWFEADKILDIECPNRR